MKEGEGTPHHIHRTDIVHIWLIIYLLLYGSIHNIFFGQFILRQLRVKVTENVQQANVIATERT